MRKTRDGLQGERRVSDMVPQGQAPSGLAPLPSTRPLLQSGFIQPPSASICCFCWPSFPLPTSGRISAQLCFGKPPPALQFLDHKAGMGSVSRLYVSGLSNQRGGHVIRARTLAGTTQAGSGQPGAERPGWERGAQAPCLPHLMLASPRQCCTCPCPRRQQGS